MSASTPLPATVAPARSGRSSLLALFGAMAISLTGTQFTAVAIPWFVLATTGSTARTATVAACETGAIVVSALFGGALIDRIPYRRVSVIADLLSGLTVAAIPALSFSVGLPFPALLVLVAIAAGSNTPGNTARSALMPDLTGWAGVRMERATATIQAIQRGSVLIGAPVAGLLIAVIGARAVLWVDAASFALSALIVGALVARPPVTSTPATGRTTRESYPAQVREGARFIGADRLLAAMVLTVMVTNFLDATYVVLIPVYAREVYDSSVALGLLIGVAGGGSLASAILFGVIGHRLPPRTTMLWSFAGIAWTRIPLLFFPPLPVALLSRGASGVAAGPINPVMWSVLFRRIPADLRGRVLGVVGAGVQLATPLGAVTAGVLIGGLGLLVALSIIVGAYIAVTTAMWFVPAFREMDAPTVGDVGAG